MKAWIKDVGIIFILSMIPLSFIRFGFADSGPSAADLPLIFDPVSRKYFVGDRTSFFLRTRENQESLEKIEVALDEGDFEPYRDAFDFKSEGKHRLRFRAKNQIGRASCR